MTIHADISLGSNGNTRAALRARRLRRQADRVHPVVAQAFRRRASQLELENWLKTVVGVG